MVDPDQDYALGAVMSGITVDDQATYTSVNHGVAFLPLRLTMVF